MTRHPRRRLLVVTGVALVLALLAACVVPGYHDVVGYYAPLYSADRHGVWFVERHTRGLVLGLGFEGFTPPAYAFVFSDRLAIRRLDRASGKLVTLRVWPTTPVSGRQLRTYRGRAFVSLGGGLRGRAGGDGIEYALELGIPRVPRTETWGVRGEVPAGAAAGAGARWREGQARLAGRDPRLVAGRWELLTAPPGPEGYPPAILEYDVESGEVATLLGEFDVGTLDDLARRRLAERSVRHEIERDEAFRSEREQLIAGFRASGMREGDALLAASRELVHRGWLPTPPGLRARPAARAPEGMPVIHISDSEFQVGLFEDLRAALAAPGSRVERGGRYLHHDGFDTSERLNAWLDRDPPPDEVWIETSAGLWKLELLPTVPATR